MVVRLAVAFLAMSQPAPSPLPRLIPFVAVTPRGDIELRIDNPSPKPLDVSLVVELVLDRPESAAPSENPKHRAFVSRQAGPCRCCTSPKRERDASSDCRQGITKVANVSCSVAVVRTSERDSLRTSVLQPGCAAG